MWRYFLCFNSGAWRNIIKTCYDIGATFLAHLVIRSEWTVRLTVNLLRIEGADLRKGRGGGRSQFASTISAVAVAVSVGRATNERTPLPFAPLGNFPAHLSLSPFLSFLLPLACLSGHLFTKVSLAALARRFKEPMLSVRLSSGTIEAHTKCELTPWWSVCGHRTWAQRQE